MGSTISKLMCRLVLTNHQRHLLSYAVGCAIDNYNRKLAICDKRCKTDIRAIQEQIDALYELKETLSKCETYYEEV